jgi:hypothetical protein
VGLPKTGTTYLQKNVFPSMFHNINTDRSSECGRFLYKRLLGGHEWDKRIGDGIVYDWASECRASNLFVSSEDICGENDPAVDLNLFKNRLKHIHKLKRDGYFVKIIFVVRRHECWLRSAYLDKLKTKKRNWNVKNLDDFALRSGRKEGVSWTLFLQEMLNFELLVLDYDSLLKCPDLFIRDIVDFTCGHALSPEYLENIVGCTLKGVEVEDNKRNVSPKNFLSLRVSRAWVELYFFLNRKVLPFKYSIDRDVERSIRDFLIRSMNRLGNHFENDSDYKLRDPSLVSHMDKDWNDFWGVVKHNRLGRRSHVR